MEVQIGSLLRGAQEARGVAIIIDVFRAFTTAAVAIDRGAEKILLVAEVDEALELRRQGSLVNANCVSQHGKGENDNATGTQVTMQRVLEECDEPREGNGQWPRKSYTFPELTRNEWMSVLQIIY